MLRDYFRKEKWINVAEPNNISPEIEEVSVRIKKILFELGVMFPDAKRGVTRKASFKKSGGGMNLDMERILSRKS